MKVATYEGRRRCALVTALLAVGQPAHRGNPRPSEVWWCLKVRPNPRIFTPKLTRDDVREIRRCRAIGMTYAEIAAEYPVKPRTIADICLRRRWKHVTEDTAA